MLAFQSSQTKGTLKIDLTGVRKRIVPPGKVLFFSLALLKCLVDTNSEYCSYDKTLSKPCYLPNVLVLLIHLGYIVIIEKGFSFLLDAG